MSKTCLICTDFTDGLERLTEFVPDLAQSNLTHVIFFHSVSLEKQGQVPREDSRAIKEAEAKLTPAVLLGLPEGVKASIEVYAGNPLEGVKRILDKYHVDLVIVGTPIRSGWKETIFGSTSTEIAKLTEAPILVIRPQLISTYTREELSLRCQHLLHYLLIPYDDGENSHYCIKRLKEHVEGFPETTIKKCMLLTVVEEIRGSKELTESKMSQAQAKLTEVQKELEGVALEVNTDVREGDPIPETLKAALHSDVSAIVIANHYQNNPLDWAVSSFAHELLHRSWYPVLLFSPKR